ncbi:MAG: endonuclease III [Gemmatimonadaceae bacterium]
MPKPAARRTSRRRRKPTREYAAEIYGRLTAAYPDPRTALHHRNPYELLVATILSAQCTDVRVNIVTPALFARYPSPAELADATVSEVEQLIDTVSFFHNKARHLVAMARVLVDEHGGQVPRTMEELTRLTGVGRKTANVVLGNAFDVNEGIVVDTHVARVSSRLGLTTATDPVKIERDLIPLFPVEQWTPLAHLFIEHGRSICIARTPRCAACLLSDICPSSRV